MIPQHLSNTEEHYSPAHIVEAARYVMGGIDLDPASCREANGVVQAAKFFTAKQDGMVKPWAGRVWLNPPGGQLIITDKQGVAAGLTAEGLASARDEINTQARTWDTKSRQTMWWRKLAREFAAGNVTQAVFLAFTVEILQLAQGDGFAHPFDFQCCFPKSRLRFSGKQPTHANLIVYLGPNVDRFRATFSEFGRLV